LKAPQARHICRTKPKTKFKLRQERHIPPLTGLGIYLDSGTTKIPPLRSYSNAACRGETE
jgi:hypothetical protein